MIPLLFHKTLSLTCQTSNIYTFKAFLHLKIEFYSCCSQNYVHYCICLSLSTTKNARMCLHQPLGHPSETHANYITFLLQEEVKINYAGQCTKYNNRFQSCKPKFQSKKSLIAYTFISLLVIYFAKSFSAKEKFVHFFSHFLEEKRVVKS